MRIKSLFSRVFRHPHSSFTTENELFQECQLLKAQMQTDNRQLKKLNEARDQIMAIVKQFSQSFQESSRIESERDRHAAFTLLVCRTRTEYSKVKKCHSCIPKSIPPLSSEPLSRSTLLNGISASDQYSQEELQKGLEDQQSILNDITAVINKIKRNCNSVEVELNRKRLLLETERKRIFHSLIFSWERQRIIHDSCSKEVDLPPPYENVPAYELDSDEELDNCPLQFLKRNSILDLRLAYQSQERPKRQRPSIPLIELIDQIRSNSLDLARPVQKPRQPSLQL
jgi:septum formation topological specificity factor MinE